MNLEFFFVLLAHLLLLSTFLIILPIFKSPKNSKLKVYRRWVLTNLKINFNNLLLNKNKIYKLSVRLNKRYANLKII